MATDPDTLADDVLELGEAPEQDDPTPETNGEQAEASADDDDVEMPTFGDPGEEEPSDTDLVRHLRSELRKTQARAKELEGGEKPRPPIVVGDKPTLESCDYDEDKFEQELDAFKERQRLASAQADEGQKAKQAEQQAWQADLTRYGEKRAALPFKDIDDVEAVVVSALSQAQQAMVVKSANDPAKLIYALGKHPTKLAALAGVTDPVKFIAATVRLETEVKMAKRKPTAEPDVPVRGSASLSSADKELERLEAKAARNGGDRSEIIAYKEKMRRK
jgi:hypothetical protein